MLRPRPFVFFILFFVSAYGIGEGSSVKGRQESVNPVADEARYHSRKHGVTGIKDTSFVLLRT